MHVHSRHASEAAHPLATYPLTAPLLSFTCASAQFAKILKKQMSSDGGGFGALVSQAGSFFGWIPSLDFSSWFGGGDPSRGDAPSAAESPTRTEADSKAPIHVGPTPRTPLHYDSMILALSTHKRPSHSFRMGQVDQVPRPPPLCRFRAVAESLPSKRSPHVHLR